MWRRLRVTFPADVPTHSTEQTFYFDDAGLIRRLDYTPDVVDRTVVAAHDCEAHQDFSGLIVPTRRRVYGRRDDGAPDRALTLVRSTSPR
jgi:hypothetical protein